MSDTLLTTTQVAAMLGCSKALIVQWRSKGGGPAFIQSGRWVRYRRADVEDWVESRRQAA
ncbi:helix-turn-helix transcriptional regulator [Corynebacterium variabile]|uniref:helix-turn-helix transcriptional regulator n=1 Tax=Corynebacterium variabile TaxID=1727 RepID=UPI003FD2B6A7